ncbi:putative manganese transporter [Maledivibacter halophilus]|uniref:Putative, 10TM heavy-metal exporter n=1 Tax=Maledivibacter halophilus TaxID=36842 RepID=A0A1T5KJ09_9FIRM|nr:putative manganese transporter [Maledivibacter halophilus]SKC63726.1 Putative, 10TM heavy-metal exporter [Maledivibacter halophilus]
MLRDIIDIILVSAENSFLQVGVFVGAVLLLFGYIDYKKSGEFVRKIEESKKWQPVLGAALGLTPGCGGAIFVMPLFVKGKVSFGTVVATLIATMGDSAFVIISTLPFHYILVSIFSFIAAIITGYIVDYYKIGDKLLLRMKKLPEGEIEKIHEKADHITQNYECKNMKECKIDLISHIGHGEGDEIDIALHHKAKGHQDYNSIGYKITHKGYGVYWIVITLGLILGIALLFQVDVNGLFIPNLGTIIGIGGTFFSIFLMIMGKKFIQDETHEEAELKIMSLKETLIHSAQETAFVSTWVYVAYLIYEIGVFSLGGGNYAAGEVIMTDVMTSAGFTAVLVGALIGLIPGCGPQVIFVTLFTKGTIPFAALLANAISQDGDALFPLLAIDKRSSLWASIITTIPAIVLGIIIYYLELNFNFF